MSKSEHQTALLDRWINEQGATNPARGQGYGDVVASFKIKKKAPPRPKKAPGKKGAGKKHKAKKAAK